MFILYSYSNSTAFWRDFELNCLHLLKRKFTLKQLTSSRPRGFSSVSGFSGSRGFTLLCCDVVQPCSRNNKHIHNHVIIIIAKLLNFFQLFNTTVSLTVQKNLGITCFPGAILELISQEYASRSTVAKLLCNIVILCNTGSTFIR